MVGWIALGIVLWWLGAVGMAWFLIVPMAAIVWSIIVLGEAILRLFEREKALRGDGDDARKGSSSSN